jgi:hypothetical protein
MHNPLRSEGDVFRAVVIVGIGAAAVIAVTLLTRPAVGAALLAAEVGLGVGLLWRGAQGGTSHRAEVAHRDDPTYRVLVLANETVGGRALLAEIGNRCKGRTSEILVVVPALPGSRMEHWTSDVDGAVEEARARLDDSLRRMDAAGINARGHVGDHHETNASLEDALGAFPADEVIISTHPDPRSGWLRRDLIDRVRDAAGVPVEHVVVDLDADRADATRTLVVANQTVGGEPLIGLLRGKANESPHRFIVISPQGESVDTGDAHERLAHTLQRLHEEGLEATGQVMDPDPFTAIQNALQFYAVDEIVISTFPSTRSGWLRNDLIARVQSSTGKPVEHVVVNQSEAEEGARA